MIVTVGRLRHQNGPASLSSNHTGNDALAVQHSVIVHVQMPKGGKRLANVSFRHFSEPNEHGQGKHFPRAFIQPIRSVRRQI